MYLSEFKKRMKSNMNIDFLSFLNKSNSLFDNNNEKIIIKPPFFEINDDCQINSNISISSINNSKIRLEIFGEMKKFMVN